MTDENMHAVGDDPAWSESYYFNFIDPVTKLGMFTRMGFRPGNGWADALHVLYLPGKRVAFTYGRREIEAPLTQYDGDLSAGQLAINCLEPFQRWQVQYDGPAQDIANAEILLERSKLRPDGWFTPAQLKMDINFECITKPHYAANSAANGERGHFEQSGRVTGSVSLDEQTWEVSGYGVRDKSWGPRDWGAGVKTATDNKPALNSAPAPFVNWFSMNFGDHAALGGACVRHEDGVMRGEGWLQRDDKSINLHDVVIETQYKPDSIVHTQLQLTATTDEGEAIAIEGNVLNLCPTKIPMPGGATFVNEGLAEFRWGEHTGYGIAEHWHAIRL
jgi:hypothetical protein